MQLNCCQLGKCSTVFLTKKTYFCLHKKHRKNLFQHVHFVRNPFLQTSTWTVSQGIQSTFSSLQSSQSEWTQPAYRAVAGQLEKQAGTAGPAAQKHYVRSA